MSGEEPSRRPFELQDGLRQVLEMIDVVRGCALLESGSEASGEAVAPMPARIEVVVRCCRLLHELSTRTLDAATGPGVGATPRQLADLSDLCLVLLAELRVCGLRLGQLNDPTADPDRVLIALEQVRSRMLARLSFLEGWLSHLLGVESRAARGDSHQRAFAARRLTGRLLARLPSRRPAGADLQGRLRRVGNVLAWLMGQDDFCHLKAEERLRARQLQHHLSQWLRGQRQPAGGQQVLSELLLFLELLRSSNGERGLAEHDLVVIRQAFSQLGDGDPYGPLSYTSVELLDELFGLDENLDWMLRNGGNKSLILGRLIDLYETLSLMRSAPGRGTSAASQQALLAPGSRHFRAHRSARQLRSSGGMAGS